MVVVPEIILFERGWKLDLYESMLLWFVREFVKAILGLGLVLCIVVFLWWINTDDKGTSDDQ
jgi:hypothetical protein